MSFAPQRPGSAGSWGAPSSRPGSRGRAQGSVNGLFLGQRPSSNERPSSAPRFGRRPDDVTVDYPGSPLSRAGSNHNSPAPQRAGPRSSPRVGGGYKPSTPNLRARPSSADRRGRPGGQHAFGGGGGGSPPTRVEFEPRQSARPAGGLLRPSSARRAEPLRAPSSSYGKRPTSARAASGIDIFANDNQPWTALDAQRPATSMSYVGITGERPEKSKPVPPKAGAFKVRKELMKPTLLRRFYDRGDLPIAVEHMPHDNRIKWKVDIEKLDYHYYLPIFFDGVRELQEPYAMFGRRGILDMMEHGPGRVVAVLPQLIVPIKNALNTREPVVVERTLKILQAMVQCDERIGECLVPYYRQLLPIFNLLKNKNKNIGDNIDYSQRDRKNIGELINETLEMFEMYGGHDAFINIKYMVPTYESCMVT